LHRRGIILTLVGATDPDSHVLKQILDYGFLNNVKSWLDDILQNKIGTVDLLLHLLSSICMLPVTKELVTSSRLGKLVSAVEKSKICVGTANEDTIKERVAKVKEQWSKVVKLLKHNKKGDEVETVDTPNSKRILVSEQNAQVVKKAKTDSQESFSLSNLLNKKLLYESVKISNSSTTTTESKTDNATALVENKVLNNSVVSDINDISDETKKKDKHIKWADVGKTQDQLSSTSQENLEEPVCGDASWSDRNKRDRLREKELLQQARKAKLIETHDKLDTMVLMHSSWHTPLSLPRDTENPSVQVASKEVPVQVRRMASVIPANYSTEEMVPINPTPLSDIEQALDMTSQSSSIPDILPFFVSPTQHSPVPVQASVSSAKVAPVSVTPVVPHPVLPSPSMMSSIASAKFVQSLGLPLFLVGQNIQALQTLAGSPGLLNAFIDSNGVYDQVRILNLVQTLTQNMIPMAQAAPTPTPGTLGSTNFQQQSQIQYNTLPAATPYQPPIQSLGYGMTSSIQLQSRSKSGYRGDQNLNEGNLHLSGYGPMTTPESIIALFAPYVKVDEIVPKNNFMFVNTSDPKGAKRAREALNGVLLGGQPLRINAALRRNKTSLNDVNNFAAVKNNMRPVRTEAVPLPRNVLGQIDYDAVRDDRGNPATKNLFVAGYGQGTTEHDLRELFSQHSQVTGIVNKGNFSFVNTAERMSAVHAREALTGAVVKGGVLRINFAKESGRLGTSFDNAYSQPATSSGQHQRNYYGHNY